LFFLSLFFFSLLATLLRGYSVMPLRLSLPPLLSFLPTGDLGVRDSCRLSFPSFSPFFFLFEHEEHVPRIEAIPLFLSFLLPQLRRGALCVDCQKPRGSPRASFFFSPPPSDTFRRDFQISVTLRQSPSFFPPFGLAGRRSG